MSAIQSTECPEAAAENLVPLSDLMVGQRGWVRCTRGTDDHGPRLTGLGLFEGVCVTVVRTGDPMIVRALGSRVGIARVVASGILVQSCPANGEGP